MFDFDHYLERLGLTSRPPANEEGLATLMHAHLHAVPFENLDIPLGRGIHLEADYLFDKIVTRRRGGYCFELNGLFGLLLDSFGFDRFPVMARVWFRDPPETPALTHTLNIVTISGRLFMADVGFGGTTARVPVPIEDGIIVEDQDGEITLKQHEPFGYMLTRLMPDGPQNQFSTTLLRAYPSDFAVGNHFTSTHSDSHFTRSAVTGLFTSEGRIGLTNHQLIIRRGWETQTTELLSAADYAAVLSEHFGLELGEDAKRLFAEPALIRTAI